MAIRPDGYYYNGQLNNYILQFMAIFTGMQVNVGKWADKDERLISVPIHYGAQDRVVASIMADNTQNKPLRLPLMSACLKNIAIDQAMMTGTGTERRVAYVPVGGLVPNDIKVIHQRRPVPYLLDMDLSIYASNTDQYFQIMEQILPLFDPQLNIQPSDNAFDMGRLTHVVLKNILPESPYPTGTDRRIIQGTISFQIPIVLAIPADVRSDYVQKIFLRVGAVSQSAVTNFDIIGELDGQNIPYDLVKNGNDLSIS